MFSPAILYRPVRGRCYVPLSIFDDLEPSRPDCLNLLRELGLRELHVDLLADAMSCAGKARYKLGAAPQEAPEVVDCSSFVQWAMGRQGISLPRYSGLLRQCGEDISHAKQRHVGDLVVRTGTPGRRQKSPLWFGHVGIAVDSVRVAHADQERGTVVVESFEEFCRGDKLDSIRYVLRPDGITYEIPAHLEIHSASELPYLVSIAHVRRLSATA